MTEPILDTTEVDRFCEGVRIFAETTECLAEILGMDAENKIRQDRGLAMAYDYDAFARASAKLGEIIHENH